MATPEWQRRIDEAPDGTPAGVLRQWWQDVGWNLNGKSIDHELPYREIVEVLQGAGITSDEALERAERGSAIIRDEVT